MKKLYGSDSIKLSPLSTCQLIEGLDILDRLKVFQTATADPPPPPPDKALRLAEEIRQLAQMERRLGKRPNHRHPL